MIGESPMVTYNSYLKSNLPTNLFDPFTASLQPMSTEYLAAENSEPPMEYVNNGYRSDEADEKDFKNEIIQDPLPVLNKKNQSAGQMLKALFRTENAVAMFKGVVKRREEKAHILLWQIIAIYLIVGICINGFFPVQLDFATKNYEIGEAINEAVVKLKI